MIALATTGVSLAIYHNSGDIYLDRSRPGFLPDEQEIKQEEQKEEEKQEQQQNQDQQQNQQQQNKNEMSKENAQQLLNAVMQDEKDVQDKVKKQIQIQGKKLDKDW
jgi:alpha-galactosidase/6-phospho-beta-glucosidase family protein